MFVSLSVFHIISVIYYKPETTFSSNNEYREKNGTSFERTSKW